jgi:hypothetical protein
MFFVTEGKWYCGQLAPPVMKTDIMALKGLSFLTVSFLCCGRNNIVGLKRIIFHLTVFVG